MNRVHQRFLQIEQEGIAKLVWFALIRAFAANAAIRTDVPPEAIAFHFIEDILKRLLADFADAFSSQFPAIALFLDIASFLQHLHQLFELLNGLVLFIAEQFFDLLAINCLQIIQATRFLELILQPLHLLHAPHHTHGLVKRQGLVAPEGKTGARLLAWCQHFKILRQFHQINADAVVAHELLHQILQFLSLLRR